MGRSPTRMTGIRPLDRWFIDEVLPFEPRFLAVARRLAADEAEVSDIVHESYARLLERADWSSLADVQGYTIRVIRNIAISKMRRAKIVRFSQLIATDADLVPDDAPDAFSIACGKDQAARLSAAMDAMPERCRTAIQRCRIEEQSPRSVAATLGLSLSTLEKRLSRGLSLLATALSGTDPLPASHCAEREDAKASQHESDHPTVIDHVYHSARS
ncbi:MAG: RNA polymerase sigma factor [Lysobacteraceae bacterium]|nr:MAG: RNA polymerase sigma factor [Xanthomonadaceae bacterium]